MDGSKAAGRPRRDRAWVTASEWFSGGRRIPYDPESARVLTEEEAAATPGALRVFERVAPAGDDAVAVWLTLLPGFPDGSYGWAQVDRILGDGLRSSGGTGRRSCTTPRASLASTAATRSAGTSPRSPAS